MKSLTDNSTRGVVGDITRKRITLSDVIDDKVITYKSHTGEERSLLLPLINRAKPSTGDSNTNNFVTAATYDVDVYFVGGGTGNAFQAADDVKPCLLYTSDAADE